MNTTQALPEKERQINHPFLALMIILIVVTIVANFIPSGEFVREVVDGRTVVDPDSFRLIDNRFTSVQMFFLSFYYGFIQTAGLMAMLFFVGVGFGVINKFRLLEASVSVVAKKAASVPFGVTAIILMVLFGLLSAFTGLYDLALVFIPIVVPLVMALGYDYMTGVAIVMLGKCVGFVAAFTNPWFTAIAHEIAELPIYSGMGYRIFCFVVLMVPSFIYLMKYATKVKKDPSLAALKDVDLPYGKMDNQEINFTPAMIRAGIIALLCFAFMLYGTVAMQFGFAELTACFAAMGLLSALAYGAKLNDICQMMSEGMKTMFMAAMVMIFARSVLYVMTEVQIIDTVIYFLSRFIRGTSPSVGAVFIFIMQSIINFFIPSGSGQAMVTMPMVVPLADIGEINRQVAVLASQFGDGISNFLWPTVGTLIAILASCGVPWGKWAKWFLPMFVIISIISAGLIVLAVHINYGPF